MEYYSSLDASQLDAETPTLFELISSNQLEALLSPSLRFVLVHYTAKYPKYLLRIANRFDELNLSLRVLVEWYFLKYWLGLFTENFYGLKRVSQTRLSNSGGRYQDAKLTQLTPAKVEERRKLTNFQIAVSIFEICGTSYILEKLNYCYEVWYPKYLTKQLKPNDPNSKYDHFTTEFKKKFVEIYPYVQSLVRSGNFAAILMYLSGASKSPSLLTYLFKINYSRLNLYDYDKNDPEVIKEKLSQGKMNLFRVNPPTNLETVLKVITNNITKPSWKVIRFILGTFFPIAIFSLKFLEWWNNSDFTLKIAKSLGNILDVMLPSPAILSKYRASLEKEKKELPKKVYHSSKLCPICKEEITNPAIIETGYVFCYSCIYNYLSQSHRVKPKAHEPAELDEEDAEDEVEDESAEGDAEADADTEAVKIDIFRGGRCPVTGKKLLGCKWNELKQEWDIEGIRRLIF